MKLGSPSRITYLFLGLPFCLLFNSLAIWRITPALARVRLSDEAVITLYVAGFAFLVTLGLAFARARRLGWTRPWAWSLLACVPILGPGVALWLGAAIDDRERREATSAGRLAGQLAVPALVGGGAVVALTWIVSTWSTSLEEPAAYLAIATIVMTPLVTAFIAGFLAGRAGRTRAEAISAAALTLSAIMTALGFAMMEGVVCLFMVIPMVAFLAIPAAMLGHWYSRRTSRSSGQVQCVAWLAVAVCAVGEATLPASLFEDTVTSEIVVDATPAQVWAQLKDIRGLPAPTETLFVLGVAHPVETVVEGPGGVGAHRVCRLSTGDMTELISVWEPERELRFNVLETPALMREATFFGRELDTPHLHGTYVGIEGGFRLVPLPGGRTRLIGTSRYALTLAPARYWNLWTREIVSQVQQRVMRHVKAKAEAR